MLAWIGTKLGGVAAKAGLQVLGWAAIAAAVLAILFGFESRGRLAERVKGQRQRLEHAATRRRVEDEIAGQADDDPARRADLRRYTRRRR